MSAVGPVGPADDIGALAGAIRERDLTPRLAESLARLVEAVGVAMRTTWDPLTPASERFGPDLVMGWDRVAAEYGALVEAVPW